MLNPDYIKTCQSQANESVITNTMVNQTTRINKKEKKNKGILKMEKKSKVIAKKSNAGLKFPQDQQELINVDKETNYQFNCPSQLQNGNRIDTQDSGSCSVHDPLNIRVKKQNSELNHQTAAQVRLINEARMNNLLVEHQSSALISIKEEPNKPKYNTTTKNFPKSLGKGLSKFLRKISSQIRIKNLKEYQDFQSQKNKELKVESFNNLIQNPTLKKLFSCYLEHFFVYDLSKSQTVTPEDYIPIISNYLKQIQSGSKIQFQIAH